MVDHGDLVAPDDDQQEPSEPSSSEEDEEDEEWNPEDVRHVYYEVDQMWDDVVGEGYWEVGDEEIYDYEGDYWDEELDDEEGGGWTSSDSEYEVEGAERGQGVIILVGVGHRLPLQGITSVDQVGNTTEC
jgi:hypothetical protein